MLTPTTGLGPHSNTNSDYVYKEFRNGDIVIIEGELKNKVIINRLIVIIGKENN